MPADDSLLFVFARAPEAGRVKTRLVPALGAAGAALLHAALVDDVCANTRGVAARRVLSVAGDAGDAMLRRIAERERMEIVAQGEGDLGARMHAAIASGLASGARRVAIVGSDSPLVPRASIERAFALLAEAEIVVGPAEDGGYWIVGATREAPWLFESMRWGEPTVYAETERRLVERGCRYALAPRAWDVDEAADLARLRAAIAADPGAAPATRAALAELLATSTD